MPYDADLATTHDPATGTDAPASWGDKINENFAALGAAWTAFTPTWTASVGDPVIGNGSIVGAYRQIGKTLDVRYRVAMGSTTTFGSGYWRLRLPNSLSVPTNTTQIVTAFCKDLGTSYFRAIGAIGVDIDADYNDLVVIANDSSNAVNSTVPFTWANGDVLVVQGTLQVA